MAIFKDKDLFDQIFADLNEKEETILTKGLSFDDIRRLLKDKQEPGNAKAFLEDLVQVVNSYRDERNRALQLPKVGRAQSEIQ